MARSNLPLPATSRVHPPPPPPPSTHTHRWQPCTLRAEQKVPFSIAVHFPQDRLQTVCGWCSRRKVSARGSYLQQGKVAQRSPPQASLPIVGGIYSGNFWVIDSIFWLLPHISSCDTILASMEEMLGKFQGDLGNISTDIRALQEQSQSMIVKLKNRRAAEGRLGGFIEALALPPALVVGIMQSEVNETFQVRLPPQYPAPPLPFLNPHGPF